MGISGVAMAACRPAAVPADKNSPNGISLLSGATMTNSKNTQPPSLWFDEFSPADPATTIVFLHGLGLGSWMWQAQVEALRAHYHCLTIDLPGNGESYAVPWLSMADSAAQVADIIQQQGMGERAHVVGLSLGGYVAMQLLANHPTVVESMVVSGINVRPYTVPWFWRTLFTEMVPLMKRESVLQSNAKKMGLTDEMIPLMARDMNRVSKLTYARVFNETFRQSMPPIFSERMQRVLGVAGDQEDQPIRDGLADFSLFLPNGQAAIVANAHHVWNGQHAQLFTEMIRSWVENEPLPSALKVV